MKVAILFNAVYPYRTGVFDCLGDDYTVIYSCHTEPNRTWVATELKHRHVFLKERLIRYGWEGFYHINPEVVLVLGRLNPDVVVLYGFGLTQQLGFLWAKFNGRGVVVWTDGWTHTERHKSWRQNLIARFIVRHSHAFIASSYKAQSYLVELGARPERVFVSRIVR